MHIRVKMGEYSCGLSPRISLEDSELQGSQEQLDWHIIQEAIWFCGLLLFSSDVSRTYLYASDQVRCTQLQTDQDTSYGIHAYSAIS